MPSVRPKPNAAAATGAAYDAAVSMTLNWVVHWLDVAWENVDRARAARANPDPADPLAKEFHAGLVAIAAAAFALDARLFAAFPNGRAKPQAPPSPVVGRPLNAGDWLGQYLDETHGVDPHRAADLGRIFELRHTSVHAPTTPRGPTLHPNGHHTSPEVVERNSDEAARLVAAASRVVCQF